MQMAKSRITIIGTGLIGGSLGLALKKANVDVELVGHDKDTGAAARAQKRGAVDATKWNLIDACEGAGLIVLAIPLDGIKTTLDALQPHLKPGVIVTDTTMTKVPVMNWARDLPAGVHYISGDPILKPSRAKSETGIDAADADLFQGATYCLVPAADAPAEAIDTLSNLASLLGASPYFIDAAEHDGLIVGAKHLPVLIASVMGAAAITSPGWRERNKLASGEFRDATQLVPGDAHAATAEFVAHRQDLIAWLDMFGETLARFRTLLNSQDTAKLEELLGSISTEREKWLSGRTGEESSNVNWADTQINFGRMFLGGLADRGAKPTERKRN
jgi:prephenate dehydrogenase